MLNSILPCNWEILISPGNMSEMTLSFLASQDALELMLFIDFLTDSWLADLTDVTLVSDDT